MRQAPGLVALLKGYALPYRVAVFPGCASAGLFGDTGSEPVTEEYPIDPGHAIAARVNTERVSNFCQPSSNPHSMFHS